MIVMLLWAICFTRLVFAMVGAVAPQFFLASSSGQPPSLAPAVFISVVGVFAGTFLGSRIYNAWPDAYRDPDNRPTLFTIVLAALLALPLHFLLWRLTRTQPPSVFILCLLITFLPCFQSKTKSRPEYQ